MAAQYTEVSLEDMERFLKRGFRSMRPKQGIFKGEYTYDLFLSPNVSIKVFTSIKPHSGTGAGVGQDAIRLLLWGVKSKHPLKRGRHAPIVKRTQNWRNSLQNRIEDLIEEYEDKDEYWESSGGREPEERKPTEPGAPKPPAQGPSDKQVRYVMFLLSTVDDDVWEGNGWDRRFKVPNVPSKDQIKELPGWMVSKLIDALKDAGYGQRQYRRWASEDGSDVPFDEPSIPDYSYSR